MRTIIVTRHPGALEWLQKHHEELCDMDFPESENVAPTNHTKVILHATPEDVAGNRVIGILPNRLSCLAAEYYEIDLPGLRPEQRGKELSCAEMEAAGARPTRYVVIRPTKEHFNCPFYTPEGYSGACLATVPSQNNEWMGD